MKRSGLADSPFFTKDPSVPQAAMPQPAEESVPRTQTNSGTTMSTMAPRHDEAGDDRSQETVIPRHHATTVESVRQAVKGYGKEAATHRFTKSEKEAIEAIVYACKRNGIRTSENEITRIAVNFMLLDYEAGGAQSLLALVLEALNT